MAMRTWMADLTGLVIGFALGGAGLLHFWPQIAQFRQPAAPRPAPSLVAAAPVRRLPVVGLPAPSAPPAPHLPGPRLPAPQETIQVPPPADLPLVVTPDEPDPAGPPHQPGHGVAGTGFFVADTLVMTAAHVVDGCRRTEIVSPFLHPTRVRIEARDRRHDIALLEAPHVRAPATLAIGRPGNAGERVVILGYPATAGRLVAQASWGMLENDKLPPQPKALTDPRDQIWLEAAAVTHGYSGGPIFDPESGKVVGLVRAGVAGRYLRGIRGMPSSGVAIGPGSRLLDDFLQDEAPGTNAFPADQWGDDPLTVVRRATVHVFCWY
jgi:S1-C subfamily serine protease